MEQTIKKVLAIFLVTILLGCTKSVYDPKAKIPGDGPNPFSIINVPANFDWSMINVAPLTVQAFDRYGGKYNHLVEVFDKEPTDNTSNLLAIGVCKQSALFDKQIVYPKGDPNQVYVRLTTPTGYQITTPVNLIPGSENKCVFDSTTVSKQITGNPASQMPNKSVKSSYTFLIEDSFPSYGDFDFNDVVAQIEMEVVAKEDYIEKMTLNIIARAVGATKRAGIFVQLPTVPIEDIEISKLNNWQNKSEQNETASYAISDDLHGLFSFHGEMINTDPKAPYRGTRKSNLSFTFKPGKVKDLNINHLDIFATTLKREGELLRTEIHQRNYTNTSKGINYRYYSEDNSVWSLLIPGKFIYPIEGIFIGTAYPDILKWASGDNSQAQWHKEGNYVTRYVYPNEL